MNNLGIAITIPGNFDQKGAGLGRSNGLFKLAPGILCPLRTSTPCSPTQGLHTLLPRAAVPSMSLVDALAE